MTEGTEGTNKKDFNIPESTKLILSIQLCRIIKTHTKAYNSLVEIYEVNKNGNGENFPYFLNLWKVSGTLPNFFRREPTSWQAC